MKSCRVSSAYLGISLGSSYYSKERLKSYLAWATISCGKFAFLVGDSIYALTHSVVKRMALPQSLAVSTRMGDEMCTAVYRAGVEADISPIVIRFSELRDDPEYSKLLEVGNDLYSSSAQFRKAVRTQVWTNLHARLADLPEICSSSSCGHAECERLDSYVIEEIAGLITMSEYRDYQLEVYPGNDLLILKDIYSGKYNEYSEILPEDKRREFLSLTLN